MKKLDNQGVPGSPLEEMEACGGKALPRGSDCQEYAGEEKSRLLFCPSYSDSEPEVRGMTK